VDTRSVSVEAAFGQQVGRASTNRLDADALRETLAKAERIARLAPADPEYLPPLPPQQYLDVPTFRESTARSNPTDLARLTQPVVKSCAAAGLFGAGIASTSVSAVGVAASSGLRAFEQRTEAEFSLTATARAAEGHGDNDSSGWVYNSHRDIEHLDVAGMTARAIDKAVRSREPRTLEPGYHTVILEPAAVAGVFGPLLWAISAKDYYKGNSALAGKLDSQILDTRLNVTADPTEADLLGTRFNGEGLAARPITWVQGGVLKNLYYDRFTAKEHGVEPTPPGGGSILRFAGPLAADVDELIRGTQRGVLITNFWYIRSVNPNDLTLTGMTRDGTFLIEDGKVVSGLRNFRFHESPLRAFAEVAAATSPLEAITLERGKMLLPAVRLPRFHLSSATQF